MESTNFNCANEAEGAADFEATFEDQERNQAGSSAARGAANVRRLRITHRARPAQDFAASGLEAQIAVADGLVEQIAFLDSHWTCLAVNRAWEEALETTHSGLAPGANYLELCEQRASHEDEGARAMAVALREIDAGKITHFDQLEIGEDAQGGRICQLRVYTCGVPGHQWRVVVRYDVTELMALKRQKRRFGNQLLNAAADERRRVARDLHDSTAQDLVALQLSLANLKRGRRLPFREKLADADEALDRLQREIRSISYLFHLSPPDQPSLTEALEVMAKGFGHRTGLNITLWLDEIDDADPKTCMAVHRLTQEALANVHRHARASDVEVRLIADERRLHLVIKDNGMGLAMDSDAPAAGVGLHSMRERIEELGGALVLRSGKDGTSVIASVPRRSARRSQGQP